MIPFNKIDRSHSTSLHKDVGDKPIVENRTFILEDNPNKKVSLIYDENTVGKYFVLDIGLGIEADDFRNYIAGKKEFFILPDNWSKTVVTSVKEMKKTQLQNQVVYFLDMPEFAQTLIISAVHKGEKLTIRDCRGFNSAISLADWNFMIDVSERTTVLEGKTAQNEQDIIALQEKDIQLTNDIASNQVEIVNNAESILGRVTINPIHNWIPNIIKSTNDSGEISTENILEHFPLESSSIALTEGSQISFSHELFEGYEGNIYTEIWTKGTGYFTVSINGQDIIPQSQENILTPLEENTDNISEQEELEPDGYPAGGDDYQKSFNFLERFTIPTGILEFTITVNSGEVEVLLSDTKRLTFFQEANAGDGIEDFVFDDTRDTLTISTTTEKNFLVDISSIKTESIAYTDQKIADLGTVFDIKGIKPTYEDLPISGNDQGDVWFVGDNSKPNTTLDEYIWIESTGWQLLGTTGGGGGVSINDGFIGKIVPAIGTINDSTLVLADGRILLKSEYPDYYQFCLNSPDPKIRSLVIDANRVNVQNMSAVYLRGSGTSGDHSAGIVGTVQEDKIKNHQHHTALGSHSHTTNIGSHSHVTDIGSHSHVTDIGSHSHVTDIGKHSHTVYANTGWTAYNYGKASGRIVSGNSITSEADIGRKTSEPTTIGPKTSYSTTIGPKTSYSTTIGPKTSNTTNLGTKISTNPISGAGSETNPYSLVVNFYVQVKNYTAGRSYVIADPAVGLMYKKGDMIKIDSQIYVAVAETTWTGTINNNWTIYGKGSSKDSPIGEVKGMLFVTNNEWLKPCDGSVEYVFADEYPEYTLLVESSPTIRNEYISIEVNTNRKKVKIPNLLNAFPVFSSGGGELGNFIANSNVSPGQIFNKSTVPRYGFNHPHNHDLAPSGIADSKWVERGRMDYSVPELASGGEIFLTSEENAPPDFTNAIIQYPVKVQIGNGNIVAPPHTPLIPHIVIR